jgi:RimJ/RimL family protein N-acetyltransferase
MQVDLVPIQNDLLIREWAKRPENAEFFRRMPPVGLWPADTMSWWTSGFYIQYNEQFVGIVLLGNLDSFHRSAELGMLIEPIENRREVVVAAATQLIDLFFYYMGYEKLSIKTLAHRASLHEVLGNYKFNKDGVLRSNIFFHGKYHDEVIYSILKDEWVK